MRKPQEGDLFRWSFNDKEYKKREHKVKAGTLYWCMSRIFRFNGEHFVDTYWQGTENRSWTLDAASKELDLTFLANERDLIKTRKPEYYDSKDIINLNHPNSTRDNVYVKKLAKLSGKAMLMEAERKLEDAIFERRQAVRDIDRYKEKINEIKNCDDLSKVWT